MALVETIRKLSRRKRLVGLVAVLALFAAILSAYRVTANPPGIHKRALTVAAASSQILVDSPKSTLVAGASLETFDALATRAKIYGEYLSSLAARKEIARLAGVPEGSISASGPFSAETGQLAYSSQSSEERAGELLQEGAQNRLVFVAQEGVPILTVSAQAATTEGAIALADASFATLKQYVNNLEADGTPVRRGVTVRELGAPEGGTLGGSNNIILMALAFLVVLGLGCAAILVIPTFVARWRDLNEIDRVPPPSSPLAYNRPRPPVPPLSPVEGSQPRSSGRGEDPAPRGKGEPPRDPIAPHPAPSR
jgi:hypothetical protein